MSLLYSHQLITPAKNRPVLLQFSLFLHSINKVQQGNVASWLFVYKHVRLYSLHTSLFNSRAHRLQLLISSPIFTTSSISRSPESVPEAAHNGFIEDEGLLKSVYVRNLPPAVTEDEIADVFKHFGKIIPDGVAIKLKKEIGICYAFVEYKDFVGVHNAVKASPVQLAGRQVYIEERRANATGASRGGSS